ncbi:hypothetical protein Tco_0289528 [Tanacetum coccineum]
MSILRKTTMIKQKMHSLNHMNLSTHYVVLEVAESSSRNVDTSNMHTFYQRHRFDYHWTKDHLLEQVRRKENYPKTVQTKKTSLRSCELCMFAVTISTAELTNIKEAMADHAWIEAMQQE